MLPNVLFSVHLFSWILCWRFVSVWWRVSDIEADETCSFVRTGWIPRSDVLFYLEAVSRRLES